jgi:hypothetical protein
MSEGYLTVAGRGRARFEIKGSEFIGHVAPARTVEEAETFVDRIREEYDDATHNVPAYRVRADPLREWASDDGEPTGSAGKPALNVLTQQELENVVAVVTRYYGGTNLASAVWPAPTAVPSRKPSPTPERRESGPRRRSRSPSSTTIREPSGRFSKARESSSTRTTTRPSASRSGCPLPKPRRSETASGALPAAASLSTVRETQTGSLGFASQYPPAVSSGVGVGVDVGVAVPSGVAVPESPLSTTTVPSIPTGRCGSQK